MNDTLIGVIVGAAASALPTIVSVFVQTRSQDRRERARLILESAATDQRAIMEFAKHATQTGREVNVPPIGAFAVNTRRLLDLLEETDGEITPERIRKFKREIAAVEDEFLTPSANR